MAISEQMKCDVCQAVKGETNHWLVAVTVPPTPEEPGECMIAFAPVDAEPDPQYPDVELEHLCGQACAHKRLSQWLESINPRTSSDESEAA